MSLRAARKTFEFTFVDTLAESLGHDRFCNNGSKRSVVRAVRAEPATIFGHIAEYEPEVFIRACRKGLASGSYHIVCLNLLLCKRHIRTTRGCIKFYTRFGAPTRQRRKVCVCERRKLSRFCTVNKLRNGTFRAVIDVIVPVESIAVIENVALVKNGKIRVAVHRLAKSSDDLRKRGSRIDYSERRRFVERSVHIGGNVCEIVHLIPNFKRLRYVCISFGNTF